MAPSNLPYYQKDEKVLCFHHELLYEAKVLDHKHVDENDKKSPYQYRVHYKGWKSTWDDWVPQDRIRKNSEENKELAANLKSDLDKMTKPAKTTAQATKKKAAGSDLSSARGSEERSTPVMGRGQKRGRDFEIEKVGTSIPSIPDALPRPKRAKVVRTQGKQSKKRPTMSTPPAQKDALSAEEEYHDKPYVAPPPPKKKSSTLKEHEYDAIISSELNGRGAHAPVKTSEKPTKPTKKLIVAGTCLDCPPVDRRKDTIAKRNRMNQGRRAEKRIKWDTDCADKKANAKQEENFNQRPAIHIPVPDNLKSYLVDDWEYVTKNLSLLPLPAEHSANEVVDIYYNEEKTKRRIGSAEHDILQEVHAGMKEYFEKTLGKILLYRFERQQYLEARRSMAANQGEWKDKAIGDIYGAEHLARLLVSLPELIAQTNMDEQSVQKLRDEMVKMTAWLGKNAHRFFTAEYEPQSQDYIEKARGG